MLENVWVERFDILERRIIDLIDSCEDEDVGPFSRKDVLTNVVSCFRNFAAEQFKFFYDGFANGRLEPSKKYPPEYALTVTLEQIGFDLEALEWAVNQRRTGTLEMLWALDAADKLAYEAIKPVLNGLNLGDVSVITYFQKFAEIRMIPYASVALIGIPFTCVPLAYIGGTPVIRDYLAIPHEVAHFIYWRGKVGERPLPYYLDEMVSGKLEWGGNWLEEVFADVYGCLVAGPVMAKIFQDLQLSFSQDRFVEDDNEHPSPILRPDIYTKVLHKKFNPEWASSLNDLWIARREERDKQDEASGEQKREILLAGEKEPLQIAEAVSLIDSKDTSLIDPRLDKPLDRMINAVLELLSEIEPKWDKNWWRGYFGADINDPYGLFEAHFGKGFDSIKGPNGVIDCPPVNKLHEEWIAQGRKAFLANASNNEGMTLKQAEEMLADYNEGGKLPVLVWLPVLIASGWATKGPKGNPVSG
ncbi:MAG: hypothetical protein KC421_00575 [Anaerolineales bacterium]|nr:hypothetical protein [Anaerolineales bacterium]